MEKSLSLLFTVVGVISGFTLLIFTFMALLMGSLEGFLGEFVLSFVEFGIAGYWYEKYLSLEGLND